MSASGASSADTTHDYGNIGIGSPAYQWYQSAGDSDAAYLSLSGATYTPYNDTTGAVSPSGRYYYCILSVTGATSQNTTHDRGYMATWVTATVTTGPVTGASDYWAVATGTMSVIGDGPVTQEGFDYGLTTTYSNSQTITAPSNYNPGNYQVTLNNLTKSTIYHYRAKAYNGQWGYGTNQIFSTMGSPASEFSFDTTSDNTTSIYATNWACQTFTTDNLTAHTVTSIRVLLQRVGIPYADDNYTIYPVTVSLRDTAGGQPTGVDLTLGTISGANIDTNPTWYQFNLTEYPLHISTTYAIVVQAASADYNLGRYIKWSMVNAGGFVGGNAEQSNNSGLTWATWTRDFNFEVYGNGAVVIQNCKVFQGYKVTGDWLIVCRYINTFPPYYPNDDIKQLFALQLISSGTPVASSSLPEWGNRVASIYLAPSQVTSLNWNGTYNIRIQGLFTGSPYTDYSLASTDWLGTDLTRLDSWVLSSANTIGTYESTSTSTVTLTINIATRGMVLNNTGGDIMTAGIPGLDQVRPNLFQISSVPYNPTLTNPTQSGRIAVSDYATNWGPDGTAMLQGWSNMLSIPVPLIGTSFFLIAMFALMLLAFPAGKTTEANILSLPILAIAMFFGLDWVYIGILGIISAFLIAKNVFMDR